MGVAKQPRWKKQTPTNDPELLEIWQNLYRELHIEQGNRKWKSLEIIGNRYGIRASSVEYWLFPQRKIYQKIFGSKKWDYEKADPEIHQKRIDYKSKYMATRRHLDDHIKKVFQGVDSEVGITREELSDSIHETTGISLHPDTIFGLVSRVEKAKGHKLLDEISGYQPPRYRLANKNH